MQSHPNIEHGDLLGQLAHLEQQVSTLTQTLQSNTQTIESLEKSLSERQSRVAELEAALHIAQHSLLSLIWLKISEYRRLLLSGEINESALSKLTQIKSLLETARSLPVTAKHYFAMNILETGSQKLRDAKIDAFHHYQNLLNTLAIRHSELLGQFNGNYRHLLDEILHTLDQKILWPIKNVRDDIKEFWQEAPEEIKFFWHGKIVRPAQQLTGSAMVEVHKLQLDIQAVLTRFARYLKKLFHDIETLIADKISAVKEKGHFETDNRQDMTGTYA